MAKYPKICTSFTEQNSGFFYLKNLPFYKTQSSVEDYWKVGCADLGNKISDIISVSVAILNTVII